jgi:hypothetical protein
MDITGKIRINHSGCEGVQLLFFYARPPGDPTVVDPSVPGNFHLPPVDAVENPARAVVVGRISVSELLDVTHLNKTVVLVAIKFPRL